MYCNQVLDNASLMKKRSMQFDANLNKQLNQINERLAVSDLCMESFAPMPYL